MTLCYGFPHLQRGLLSYVQLVLAIENREGLEQICLGTQENPSEPIPLMKEAQNIPM